MQFSRRTRWQGCDEMDCVVPLGGFMIDREHLDTRVAFHIISVFILCFPVQPLGPGEIGHVDLISCRKSAGVTFRIDGAL